VQVADERVADAARRSKAAVAEAEARVDAATGRADRAEARAAEAADEAAIARQRTVDLERRLVNAAAWIRDLEEQLEEGPSDSAALRRGRALSLDLETAVAERAAAQRLLAEAQAEAERTVARLTADHGRELDARIREHDRRMSEAAGLQARVIAELRAEHAAALDRATRSGAREE
jgi:hypothetical protein